MANPIKDIEAPSANLGDMIVALAKEESANGLDRVRSVLAARMNQYTDIPLTAQDCKDIYKAFRDIETGSSTGLVMICSARKCLYRDRCALFKSSKAPEGRECLHENKVMSHAMDQYIESLEVALDNYPEMVMVNQLVEYELIEHRCNAILSYEHRNMKMETVVGIDDDGNVVTKEEVSHALIIKDLTFKKRLLLLQELTATRKEKYKKQAALKETSVGPAKIVSDMKKKMEALKNKSIEDADVQHGLNALSDMDDLGDI